MKSAALLSSLALALLSTSALAADVKTKFLDHSNDGLIDEKTAIATMDENVPAKVWKIYPASKFAFLSQVEGGINAAGTCVVAARVMVLPLTVTLKVPMFRPLPKLTATAYDAVASSGTEACKALAKDKLKTATQAIVSNIIKT